MQKKLVLATTLLIISLLFTIACKSKVGYNSSEEEKEEVVDESTYFYGINIDSLAIHQSKIKRDAFLAGILLSHDVNYNTIHQITQFSKGIFDFRKIRAGQNYYILHSNDSIKTPQYFIYEKNLAEFVVCDIRNSICVYEDRKPVRTVEKVASGEIESSLYLTLDKNDIHPTLALSLADIYAWTIDFYHLQKGDKFKVIYEENYVDSASLGVTKIKAAIFDHYGKEIYAARYKMNGDSLHSYFDDKGASLQKTFLKSPLKFGRKTSGFSWSRKHPVTGRRKAHKGTDYAAPTGTPIRSTADGVIHTASRTKYNGNYVKVKHNSAYMTQYLHMSKFAKGIKPGKYVQQGEIIGYVGSTGLATGPHVCYRFWKHGSQVDHTREEVPPSDPIPAEELPSYLVFFDSVRLLLDTVSYPVVKEATDVPIANNH